MTSRIREQRRRYLAAVAALAGSLAAAVAPAPGALAQAPETAPAPRLAQAKVSDDGYALSATRDSRAQVTPAAAITLGLGICGGFGWLVVAADRRRRPASAAAPAWTGSSRGRRR